LDKVIENLSSSEEIGHKSVTTISDTFCQILPTRCHGDIINHYKEILYNIFYKCV